MGHIHKVEDSDGRFVVDAVTRRIINNSGKVRLMQLDHNSERLTFEIPRYIDEHDMTLCDKVEVHYINTDGIYSNDGVYVVDDLRVSPESDDIVTCSWLISQNVTQYVGSVAFALLFACTTGDVIDYQWHTDIHDGIIVCETIDNADIVVVEYADVLEQWRVKLFGAGQSAITDIENATSRQVSIIESKGAATLATIPADYTTTFNMANESVRTKADAIICTSGGERIVANDSSDAYLRGLRLFGKTTPTITVDGIPSPSPDNPQTLVNVENVIVSIYGKNLLRTRSDSSTYAGITYTPKDDGTVTAVGTVNEDEDSIYHIVMKDDPITLPKGEYVLNGSVNGSEESHRILIYDADTWEYITECTHEPVKFTLDKSRNVFVYIWVKRGTVINQVFEPAIYIEPNNASKYNYETYIKPSTISISRTLSSVPITPYDDQWICDEIDYERGVYIKRVNTLVFDGSENWMISDGTHPVMYISDVPGSINNQWGRFSHGEYIPLSTDDYHIGAAVFSDGIVKVRLGYEAYVETFKTFLTEQNHNGTPVTIMYPLATPIELPLNTDELDSFKMVRSNRPNTTILNDSGINMELSYNADIKKYISNQILEAISNWDGDGSDAEGQTYLLIDETGNEIPAVYVASETVFDATANDIRQGKVAATEYGVTVGTKEIPSYKATEGSVVVKAGKPLDIPLFSDMCQYTTLQSIVCDYNNTAEDSVSVQKVAIKDKVYAVQSDEVLSTVTVDSVTQTIKLGLINDGDSKLVVRYMIIKEDT